MSILCHRICLDSSICSEECFQSKMLHVCLAGCIIYNRIICCIVGFDLRLLASASLLGNTPYLFKLVHQGRRILECLCITIVKSFRENLIDNPIFAFTNQLILLTRLVSHTPVSYHRLRCLKLGSSDDKTGEVCCL